MSFSAAFDAILQAEGGYSDHPDDSGGATNLGITVDVARSNGYDGDMRDLSVDDARRIYRSAYWDRLRLDEVESADPHLAERLFDMGVHTGAARAGRYFQRVLNVLNQRGTLYPDLVVDGAIGPATLFALRRCLAHRGSDGALVIRRALNAMLGVHYITLCERREKDEAFVYGWLLRRLWLS